jgi:hypothetical protein
MKNILFLIILTFGFTTSWCQEIKQNEFAGDNFSLEGTLAMLKKATTIKQFERIINDKKNNVNNLDLNGDGEIDYVNVEDIESENTHVLVLSTFVTEQEKQDIATISIEKTADSEAYIQIEGDTDLYAANTLIEPTEEKQTLKSDKGGPNTPSIIIQTLRVNVWSWPSIQYIYANKYIVWVSPYRWNFKPNWWRPWHPFGYNLFFVKCAPHRMLYHSVGTRRIVSAKKLYVPLRRSTTLVVHNNRALTTVHQTIRGAKIKNTPIRRTTLRYSPIKGGLIRGVRLNGRGRR